MVHIVKKNEDIASEEAEYGGDFCYEVFMDEYLMCICSDLDEAIHIAKALDAMPYEFPTGTQATKT